jgi:hypothetical protein
VSWVINYYGAILNLSSKSIVRLLLLPIAGLLIGTLSSNTNADFVFVDADASGDDSGSDWDNAVPTIQGGINAASSGDDI